MARGNGGDGSLDVIGEPGGDLGVRLEGLEKGFGTGGDELLAGVENEVLGGDGFEGREFGAGDVENLMAMPRTVEILESSVNSPGAEARRTTTG